MALQKLRNAVVSPEGHGPGHEPVPQIGAGLQVATERTGRDVVGGAPVIEDLDGEAGYGHGDDGVSHRWEKSTARINPLLSYWYRGIIPGMGKRAPQRIASRIRDRLKTAGVGNLRAFFRSIGSGTDIVSRLLNGDADDTGALKLAHAAIISGVQPSELFRDIENELLNPPLVSRDDAKAIELQGWPERYPDAPRLAVIADTVMQYAEEHGGPASAGEIGEMVTSLYGSIVERDPGISHLELRRQTFAFLLGIDLPQPSHRKARGRPSTADR